MRRRDGRDLDRIVEMVRELSVTNIIVGLPLQMDGEEGEAVREARAFGAEVTRATGISVSYVDERLTTRQAERQLISWGASRARRRQVGDQVAAALILQQALAAGLGTGR
jgi:putative Holliday junction resolvase